MFTVNFKCSVKFCKFCNPTKDDEHRRWRLEGGGRKPQGLTLGWPASFGGANPRVGPQGGRSQQAQNLGFVKPWVARPNCGEAQNCFGLGPIIKSVLIEAKPIKEGPKRKQGQEAQLDQGFVLFFIFGYLFCKIKGTRSIPILFNFILCFYYMS